MNEEYLRCPCCGRVARHRVIVDRVLAARHWCMACFGTWTGGDEAPPQARQASDPASEAA